MRYFVIHPSGQKYGPADLTTLNTWIQEGRVTVNTELEDEATGARLSAASLPGLVFGGGPVIVQPQPQPQPGPTFQTGPTPSATQGPTTPTYGAPQPGPSPFQNPPSYGQVPMNSPYQRMPVGVDSQGDFTKSIIFSALGVVCCPIVFSVLGIYFGNQAKVKGHPNGQLAFTLGIVSLVVGLMFGAFMGIANR